MSEKVMPGSALDSGCIREAVCINTKKIYDSCKDKDCLEDLRFYPTCGSQSIIDRAISVKAGKAELLYVYIDVEPVGFHRGCYTVDVRYYYRVTASAFTGAVQAEEITGLCIFDKRVILYGGEGSARVFSSQYTMDSRDEQRPVKSNVPTAVVEAVDPLVLNMKLVEACEPHPCDCGCGCTDLPPCVCSCFGCELSTNGERRVYVTLGQFSIIRLERDTQLLMPAYDYCLPEKECATGGGDEDPCELFRRVAFPVEEFFPSRGRANECCKEHKNC